MTKLQKILIWTCLPVMLLSIMIGYAAISEDLRIFGEAHIEAEEYIGVYIKEVTLVNTSNATSPKYDYILPTNLDATVNATASGGSVTYRVTVHNNTDVTYWYMGQNVLASHKDNSLIGAGGGITVITKDKLSDTGATFNTYDWIPPQTERDFYVTYTFGANAQGTKSTLINFRFGLKMDSVYDKFLAVLNDTSPGGGYETLSNAFDEQYADGDGCVIGNVGSDKALFDRLFDEKMTITVDGVEVPVTVMVRRENIDGKSTGDSYDVSGGPTGCEYTVYITVDDLSSPTGQVTVHAITYTQKSDGSWYRIGQLYEGTANKSDYDITNETYDGAFNVYSWLATAGTYEVTDNISYKVGQQNGDQYEILKALDKIISVEDQNFFNTIDNTGIFKKVYDILRSEEGNYDPGIIGLRTAFENAAPYYRNLNNGQEFKVVRDYTRAELIPYLIDIQHALDYYYQIEHTAE